MSDHKVEFHYIKSNFFRVIHADGAAGSITPSGDIFFTLWNQRAPMPQMMVHAVSEEGEVQEEISAERIGKSGILREMEVGITMRPENVEELIAWLTQKLESSKRLKEARKAKQNP
jgi:hypothetical protein